MNSVQKRFWVFFVIVVVLAVLIVGGYFLFFHTKNCENEDCFKARQIECKRTEFVRDSDAVKWVYKIKGERKDMCKIYVEVLKVKRGDISNEDFEGKFMNCMLNLQSTNYPESDITKCTGVLKEELQNKIIQNLHVYVIENVGSISEQFNKAF